MDYIHLDDQLWYQAMLAERFLKEAPVALDTSRHEAALRRLLPLGIYDHKPYEKPMDAASRSMRYSTALTVNLLEMLKEERKRFFLNLLASDL
jgi:hypothetical protein